MSLSDTYLSQEELELATPDELKVIDAHTEQRKIVMHLNSYLNTKLTIYLHHAVTPQLLSEVQSIFIDGLRHVAQDQSLLRMPFVEFDVEVVWSEVDKTIEFNIKNQALRQILNAEYGEAFKFDELKYVLRQRYAEALIKETIEYRKKYYMFSGIPKSDYPVSDSVMTAAEIRKSGLIPQGYELLPVTVIDALIHAGLNAYDCAVGGHSVVDELRDAAVAAQNVLKRRVNLGAKSK